MARDCVLVVDDDEDIRESLIALLEAYGWSAVGAKNGFEAMEKLLTSDNTCLIFLDLSMPLMDGNAFREEQVKREALKDIPVVLISAFGDLTNHSKAMQVDAYLQKPLDAAHVLDIARRYCECAQASA